MSTIVNVLRTGRMPYKKSIDLQKYIYNEINNPTVNEKNFRNVIILTEHNPVYTIGIRTKSYTIDDENRLRQLGAEFYKTNRGGLITFHGPGQLVVYPILHLKQFNASIRWYVAHLEQTVIDLCHQYEIKAETTKDTGIWINDKKICAIGIHASRYITSHGIGLNCNTDLNWFEHIIPCGIEGKGVTSISNELQNEISIDSVIPKFLVSFSRQFNCELVEFQKNDTLKILKSI